MTTRVGILISGSGSNMVALAKSMTGDHPGRAALVLSNVPGAGGLDKAAAMGIATQTVDHKAFDTRADFDAAVHAALIDHRIDFVCHAGFMRILTAEFVEKWQGRMLNIHPSLLPKHPGLRTHARALEAGDSHHGCSVHEVIPELDAGPLRGQARLAIGPDDTAETLAARVLPLEHRLYPAVLRAVLEGEDGIIEITEKP